MFMDNNNKEERKNNYISILQSEQPKGMQRINLLLISEDEDNDDNECIDEQIIDEKDHGADYSENPQKVTKYPYCWIKNLYITSWSKQQIWRENTPL